MRVETNTVYKNQKGELVEVLTKRGQSLKIKNLSTKTTHSVRKKSFKKLYTRAHIGLLEAKLIVAL